MNFDQDTPLNRIKGETIKANTALMDYWLMGAGRSLEKLRQSYTKAASEKAPTVHLRTLQEWSSRDHWQARIAQQAANDNALILQKIEDDNAVRLAEYQARHMSEAEVIARLSDQARGDMGQFAGVRAQTDLAQHPHSELVKKITQHYNQVEYGTKEDRKTELKARITLELYGAQKALELLGRHYGIFAADNKHQNLNIDMSDLTDEQLKRIADGEDPLNVISD